MVLAMDSIAKSFGERPVLEDVTLSLEPGQSLAVVAPSGVGKSTLLSIAGLLLAPTAGTLTIDGRDVAELSDDEISALRGGYIGFLFQHTQLIGSLTALENVVLAADFARGAPEADRATTKAPRERARELLCALGLEAKLESRPRELSIGQKRRVATARALLCDPTLIVADEPTNDLDEENARLVTEALFAPVRADQAALLLATHDSALAQRADLVYTITPPIDISKEDA